MRWRGPTPSARRWPARRHRRRSACTAISSGSSTGSGSTPATGILLRHDGFVDGETCSTTRLSDLVVDAALADTEFRPPPGAVVRARHELLRDHLAEMGVDPDSVDLDDPAQVRAALRGAG